ncbi:MAG TPA: LCP family protein [Patescibacteria group bacterium]|nr:LCP family protein [Patescibacteria group bacterium]
MHKKAIVLVIIVVVIVLLVKFFIAFGKFVPAATHVIFHPGAVLKETNGKTNVLLLGIGGGSHDGPNLTDTIMLANIDWNKAQVTLISIPRDLWVPSLNQSVNKINEAYAIGGLSSAEKVANDVTGQSIDYAIRLDFQGFVKGIDQIGGVDVTVVRTLDDYEYPISGKEEDVCGHTQQEIQTFTATDSAEEDLQQFFPCRYKHLHFDKGPQHMDGETALEYARSRHGVGEEGTDFARSARQQLVIEAVRSKLINSAFFNPGKLVGLYNIVKNSIDTNITDSDLGLFLDRLSILKTAKVTTAVLDFGDYMTGRPGLLMLAPITPEYDNLSVLIPRVGNGNFSEIQKFINCEITKGNCTIMPSPAVQK